MSTKIFGLLLALVICPSLVVAEEAVSKTVTDETWNWMPAWRDKTDCGPNALYVLMQLEGHKVALEDVKKLVPLDPVKGCSMETLIQAAEQLGFPLEARFVKPGELSKLPRPFIFHGITSQEKNLGHFVVAVDYDTKKGNYTLIDPIRESFGKNPEESVFMGFSGYVLVPKYPSARKWNLIAGTSLILCGLTCGTMIFMRHKRSCQPTTDLAKEP